MLIQFQRAKGVGGGQKKLMKVKEGRGEINLQIWLTSTANVPLVGFSLKSPRSSMLQEGFSMITKSSDENCSLHFLYVNFENHISNSRNKSAGQRDPLYESGHLLGFDERNFYKTRFFRTFNYFLFK